MDANDAMPNCEIDGCRWRVLNDPDDDRLRCHEHNGSPTYAYRTSEWGDLEEWRRPDE